jgi:hypothetical protein
MSTKTKKPDGTYCEAIDAKFSKNPSKIQETNIQMDQ